MSAKAWLSKKLGNNKILCTACAHACILQENEFGKCGVRVVKNNELVSTVYGIAGAVHIDPIEKKPLFHFLPSSKTFSIGTVGCNFSCKFCQNASLSQFPKENNYQIFGEHISPKEIVKNALYYKTKAISYTYNEPAVFFEFAYDTAKLAHENGLKNVFVTSGYETKKALKTISLYLDAMNIDLKSFNNSFYEDICQAKLKPVLQTIQNAFELGIWIEITTLIIPTLNDSTQELKQIANFIANISKDIPWHISAFHPDYKLKNIPRTPFKTLKKAYDIAKEAGLNYVFSGNVDNNDTSSTYCPGCGFKVIDRNGYLGEWVYNHLENGLCPKCKTKIAGIWQ